MQNITCVHIHVQILYMYGMHWTRVYMDIILYMYATKHIVDIASRVTPAFCVVLSLSNGVCIMYSHGIMYSLYS